MTLVGGCDVELVKVIGVMAKRGGQTDVSSVSVDADWTVRWQAVDE